MREHYNKRLRDKMETNVHNLVMSAVKEVIALGRFVWYQAHQIMDKMQKKSVTAIKTKWRRNN